MLDKNGINIKDFWDALDENNILTTTGNFNFKNMSDIFTNIFFYNYKPDEIRRAEKRFHELLKKIENRDINAKNWIIALYKNPVRKIKDEVGDFLKQISDQHDVCKLKLLNKELNLKNHVDVLFLDLFLNLCCFPWSADFYWSYIKNSSIIYKFKQNMFKEKVDFSLMVNNKNEDTRDIEEWLISNLKPYFYSILNPQPSSENKKFKTYSIEVKQDTYYAFIFKA